MGWIFRGGVALAIGAICVAHTIAVLAIGAVFALEVWQGPLGCEHESGDSIYGDARATWMPPGVTCDWRSQGIDEVEPPPTWRGVVAGMYLVTLIGTLVVAARLTGRDSEEAEA